MLVRLCPPFRTTPLPARAGRVGFQDITSDPGYYENASEEILRSGNRLI